MEESPIFDRGQTLRLAAWYAAEHRYAESARAYLSVAERDRGDVLSLRRAAELDARRGAVVDAASAMRAHAERLMARGWRLTSLVRYGKLSDLLIRVPRGLHAQYADIEGAVQRLRADIGKHRKLLAEGEARVRGLEQKGDDEGVVELSRQMVAIQPDNPVLQARLAEALCRLGRANEAIAPFRLAAEALMELERVSDALRVVERLLHFRAGVDDSLLAASLHLERNESNDAVRAVPKLSACLRADPENLDALLLLARAFEAMRQPSRAARVLLETGRIARSAGEAELAREISLSIDRAARADPEIAELVQADRDLGSAPDAAHRSALVSVADDDLVPIDELLDAESDESEAAILEDVSLEEISEIWVVPEVSKAARRALDDAAAFTRLRLHSKAEAVLRAGIEAEPHSLELHRALQELLDITGA